MTEKRNITVKDLECLLELLESGMPCHINHCDVCVGYGREHAVKVEFWRLRDLLIRTIKENHDRK